MLTLLYVFLMSFCSAVVQLLSSEPVVSEVKKLLITLLNPGLLNEMNYRDRFYVLMRFLQLNSSFLNRTGIYSYLW